MKKYTANWPATILAAVGLHAAAAFGLPYVLPIFETAPKIQSVAEIEWVDAELADDVAIDDAEIFSEPAQNSSPFNAEDLVIPELNIPAPTIEPLKPIEVKPIERPKPPKNEQPAKIEEPPPKIEPAPKVEEPPKDEVQRMAKPPVTVSEVQPDKSAVKNFSGYISIAVRIGKDGKVKSTEILQSSGDNSVDEIANAAAKKWTFQPALDQIGRPMECDKIITFDLRK